MIGQDPYAMYDSLRAGVIRFLVNACIWLGVLGILLAVCLLVVHGLNPFNR